MKKLTLVLLSLVLFGFVGNVLAKQPKEDVYHCGCNADGTDLVWTRLNVSKNSNGHRNHEADDPESCYTWVIDVWTWVGDYDRGYDDCEDADGGVNINGVGDCDYTDDFGYDFGTDGDDFDVGDSCSD